VLDRADAGHGEKDGRRRPDQAMRRMWHPWWGDRRQALALIGVEMDERTVRAAFDACLLIDAEMQAGPMLWQLLPDAVPAWSRG